MAEQVEVGTERCLLVMPTEGVAKAVVVVSTNAPSKLPF
jgi:hypothetical protein